MFVFSNIFLLCFNDSVKALRFKQTMSSRNMIVEARIFGVSFDNTGVQRGLRV